MRPRPEVVHVGAGGEEVFNIRELAFALRLTGPVELRMDQVFLAHDPERVTRDFDPAASFELEEPVVLPLADHEIDLDLTVPPPVRASRRDLNTKQGDRQTVGCPVNRNSLLPTR